MNAELMEKLGREVFDYQVLMDALSAYRSPRSHVTLLLRRGDIVRVKKGLYILGEAFRREPLEAGWLANLIYGPSMVSLDYALAFHGLTPERVEEITSVATGRSRRFATPVGTFSYRPTGTLLPGMMRQERNGHVFLMASPERALADKLCDDRWGGRIRTQAEMRDYLLENLRIGEPALAGLDVEALQEIGRALGSLKVSVCCAVIRQIREEAVHE